MAAMRLSTLAHCVASVAGSAASATCLGMYWGSATRARLRSIAPNPELGYDPLKNFTSGTCHVQQINHGHAAIGIDIGKNSYHVVGFNFGWFGTMQSASAALDISHPYGSQYDSRNCNTRDVHRMQPLMSCAGHCWSDEGETFQCG
jgi:hypothetical protein